MWKNIQLARPKLKLLPEGNYVISNNKDKINGNIKLPDNIDNLVSKIDGFSKGFKPNDKHSMDTEIELIDNKNNELFIKQLEEGQTGLSFYSGDVEWINNVLKNHQEKTSLKIYLNKELYPTNPSL